MNFDFLRRMFGAFVMIVVVATFATNVSAQKVTSKEADYAKKMQDAKLDVAGRMKIVEKFMKEFPKSEIRDKVAKYISGQIGAVADLGQRTAFLETYGKLFDKPEEADYAMPSWIEVYSKSKRHDEEFAMAAGYLSRPYGMNDLRTRLFVAIDGGALAYAGNKKYADQLLAICGKALEIIESGTKPAEVTDEDWKLGQTSWKGQFHRSIGFVQNSLAKYEDAYVSFQKATAIDPNDVSSWAMLGFITDAKYQDLARSYTIAEGAAQTELRKKAEIELDKVIDLFARVVGLTEGDQMQALLNSQIRANLETYYKFRNKGSIAGMEDLIKKYKKQ